MSDSFKLKNKSFVVVVVKCPQRILRKHKVWFIHSESKKGISYKSF